VDYDYPAIHLTMHCFICSILEGEITLVEHNDAKWLTPDELNSVQWLSADEELIMNIITTGNI
jgi:8-oxo-dGTP diphosphatase